MNENHLFLRHIWLRLSEAAPLPSGLWLWLLREILLTHKELAAKIEALEKKYAEHDQTIKEIFQAIRQLLEPLPVKEKKIIGFRSHAAH